MAIKVLVSKSCDILTEYNLCSNHLTSSGPQPRVQPKYGGVAAFMLHRKGTNCHQIWDHQNAPNPNLLKSRFKGFFFSCSILLNSPTELPGAWSVPCKNTLPYLLDVLFRLISLPCYYKTKPESGLQLLYVFQYAQYCKSQNDGRTSLYVRLYLKQTNKELNTALKARTYTNTIDLIWNTNESPGMQQSNNVWISKEPWHSVNLWKLLVSQKDIRVFLTWVFKRRTMLQGHILQCIVSFHKKQEFKTSPFVISREITRRMLTCNLQYAACS